MKQYQDKIVGEVLYKYGWREDWSGWFKPGIEPNAKGGIELLQAFNICCTENKLDKNKVLTEQL